MAHSQEPGLMKTPLPKKKSVTPPRVRETETDPGPLPGTMTRVPHSMKMDFSGWNMLDTDTLAEKLNAEIASALETTFEEDPPHLCFPTLWATEDGKGSDGIGGPPPEDPATLYLTLPLAGEQFEGPVYQISLEEVVNDMIEDKLSGIWAVPARKIASRLRELADKIDSACWSEES